MKKGTMSIIGLLIGLSLIATGFFLMVLNLTNPSWWLGIIPTAVGLLFILGSSFLIRPDRPKEE